MRSVTVENIAIVNKLPFEFENEEFDLNKWGVVDFYCYHEQVLILIEIEKGQKHPNTNVLKIWPYLEENLDQKILLIQLIRPENNAPKNRLRLCKFTGKQLEKLFPNKFKYIYYNWHPNIIMDLKNKIQEKLEDLK
jgi:hypothetical protein